jgi:hypothetical protein
MLRWPSLGRNSELIFHEYHTTFAELVMDTDVIAWEDSLLQHMLYFTVATNIQ